jgi:hypothetical protein
MPFLVLLTEIKRLWQIPFDLLGLGTIARSRDEFNCRN